MPSSQEQVLLATRLPVPLKASLSRYCLSHGIKINYFVTQAIRERLREMAEDAQDVSIAKDRLKTAQFASKSEMEEYFHKRGIKS